MITRLLNWLLGPPWHLEVAGVPLKGTFRTRYGARQAAVRLAREWGTPPRHLQVVRYHRP